MKKILQSLLTALAGVLLLAVPASAQTIENGNGTGSTNTITSSNSFDCDVDNSNDIDVTVDSSQNASSGDATANGNTSVDDVSTGDASNDTSINTSIDISNGAACLPVVTNGGGGGNGPVPSGGQGGGNVQGATSGGMGGGVVLSSGVRVAALPATGETAPAEAAAIGTALLSGMAMVMRFGNAFRKELAL